LYLQNEEVTKTAICMQPGQELNAICKLSFAYILSFILSSGTEPFPVPLTVPEPALVQDAAATRLRKVCPARSQFVVFAFP
jgi:hypothetical protein